MSCEVVGCTKANKPRDSRFCSMHRARFTRHGDPLIKLRTGQIIGEANLRWTGANASYNAMHLRVRAAKGPAKTHPCALCMSRTARHWAYDHEDVDERQSEQGPYSVLVTHYLPMCVACHKSFDLAWIRERAA